jgi:Tol biopolymer transport system component
LIRRLLILSIILLLSPANSARMAQHFDTPLIVVSEKAAYKLNGDRILKLNLAGGLLSNVTISPDGKLLLYQTIPPAISASLEDAPDGLIPRDIYLYDLENNRNSTVFKQGKSPAALMRGEGSYQLSAPQWSADGKQIVWAKRRLLREEFDTIEFDVYDIATRKIVSSFDTGLELESENTPMHLAWSAAGLSVAFSPTNVATFSPDGKEIGRASLDNAIQALLPVKQNGHDYVGALDNRNVLHLLEPRTGGSRLADGGLERYSMNGPDPSLSVTFERRPDRVIKWRLIQPNGSSEPVATRPFDVESLPFAAGVMRFFNVESLPFAALTISPDGAQIAYIADDAAFVWKDGKVAHIKGTGAKGVKVQAVIWSPLGWRVRRASSNGLTTMSADTKSKLTNWPLLLTIKGDLYAWTKTDKTPRQLTHRGDVSPAVMSPDGKWAVYRTSPSKLGPGAFRTYTDVWLLDIATGKSHVIVSGPAPDQQDTVRVSPVWSPDSQKIAWIEQTWPGQDHRVVIHDTASNTSTVAISGLPFPSYMFDTHMAWRKPGLVIAWKTSKRDEARVYSPDGTLLSKTDLGLRSNLLFPMWIADGEKFYAGIVGLETFVLIDPQTGTKQQTVHAFELYSPNMPDKGFVVFYDEALGNSLDNWRVRLPNGEIDIVLPVGGTQSEIALSPAGMELAYSQYGAAFVYRDGEVLLVPPTGNEEQGNWPYVAWGPVSYRLHKEK